MPKPKPHPPKKRRGSCKEDRAMAVNYVETHQPTWVIVAPPCTAFSQLQAFFGPKMDPENIAALNCEGKRHLHCVINSYKLQIENKRHFLHEHPAGAKSWQDVQIQALLRQRNVNVLTSDQCMYGLMTRVENGEPVHAKKPTKWASSSPRMSAQPTTRCSKQHDHQLLVGGRATNAAFYTPELITDILRGMRDTAVAAYK